MNWSLFSLLLVAQSNPAAIAERPCFEFAVSGELVSKLPDDTELDFSCITFGGEKPRGGIFRLKDLPIKVPYEEYKGRYWYVGFESQQQGEMFTVALSRDLFDRPRKINIKLDCPNPCVRPIFGLLSDVKYTTSITQRMEYYDLPNWDQIRKRFAAPIPPVLTVRRASDRKIVFSKPMEEVCMASRWWGDLRFVEFESGSTYEFSVIYDSGGLFPPMESTYDFTFKKELHGPSPRSKIHVEYDVPNPNGKPRRNQ